MEWINLSYMQIATEIFVWLQMMWDILKINIHGYTILNAYICNDFHVIYLLSLNFKINMF